MYRNNAYWRLGHRYKSFRFWRSRSWTPSWWNTVLWRKHFWDLLNEILKNTWLLNPCSRMQLYWPAQWHTRTSHLWTFVWSVIYQYELLSHRTSWPRNLYDRDGKFCPTFKSGTEKHRFSVPLLMTWCHQIDHPKSKSKTEWCIFCCTTDLFRKISNGHISARGHPLYFMLGSVVGFSGSADQIAPFRVGPNSIGMWEKTMREE